MTRHVYVDEVKSGGYVLVAVSVADPVAERKVIRTLVQPGNRRLHMVDERPRRRPGIVATLVATDIEVTIYDTARRYRADRPARAACLAALVEDLAEGAATDTRLVFERDDSLVQSDRRQLYQLVRRAGLTAAIEYYHQRGHEEPLLALPDLVAWCWVRSEQWRRQIAPVLRAVRTV